VIVDRFDAVGRERCGVRGRAKVLSVRIVQHLEEIILVDVDHDRLRPVGHIGVNGLGGFPQRSVQQSLPTAAAFVQFDFSTGLGVAVFVRGGGSLELLDEGGIDPFIDRKSVV